MSRKKVIKRRKAVYNSIVFAETSLFNKTGSWRNQRPEWNKKKCINCMLCVIYCPDNCILAKKGIRQETDFDYCKGCGVCAKVCPVKAITMKKEGLKLEDKKS